MIHKFAKAAGWTSVAADALEFEPKIVSIGFMNCKNLQIEICMSFGFLIFVFSFYMVFYFGVSEKFVL